MDRRRHAPALALALAMLVPGPVGAPGARADDAPVVSLRGPFGRVVGTYPDPATAAPDERPLDTWMREATLELAVDPPLPDGATISVTTAPVGGGEQVEVPVTDDRWISAPNVAGEHVLSATLEVDGREPTRFAWLLEVPDRPGSPETLLLRPPVEASLVQTSGTVLGLRGHGCYVDTCQEVGYRPPATSLAPLHVAVAEPLTLELDDGSAVGHWEGRLEPLPGTASETRLAQATFDEPVAGPVLEGLAPDAPGEWLLELRVDYDRDRGWQWYLFRLVAE